MEAIGVIDYGMGNLHSLVKSLERVSSTRNVTVSYDPEVLLKCDHLVLPGVGGVKACMKELHRLELDDLVREASTRVPLLGICLGMQVLLDRSDENGGVPGLELIPGSVERFPDPVAGDGERLKVPHMGWNQVHRERDHPIWEGVPDDAWFYFVHSYRAVPKRREHVLATTDYIDRFASAIARDNIVAFQFHPEKSQRAGLQLLANFVQWDGST